MKSILFPAILTLSLLSSACATRVAIAAPAPRRVFVEGRWLVAPAATAVWVPVHYERRGFARVRVAGHWRI